MKSLLLSLLIAPVVANAAITINFSGVAFTNADGTPLADGSLIQLVASTSDQLFSSPTSTSFVSGDDRVIASFIVSSATSGVQGGVVTALSIGDYTTTPGLTAGDFLMLRWFSGVSADAQAPGAVSYGEYRTDTRLDGTDMDWVAPADAGGTFTLSVITSDFGGSVAPSALRTNLSTAPIPEPSTYAALVGLAAIGFVAFRRRRQA